MGGGEAGAAVAGFGVQGCCADGAGAGRAGEDVGVAVGGELVFDLVVEDSDLIVKSVEHGDEGAGGVGVGLAVGSAQSSGCAAQVGVQNGGAVLAGVAGPFEPVPEPGPGAPVRPGWGVATGRSESAACRRFKGSPST